jgi:predicted SnoaL-like aldol condensation-catalyzing enzyme
MTNLEVVQRFENEFKNKANINIVDELFTDDFVHHLPFPGLPAGREGQKTVGRMVFGAVGGIKTKIDLSASEGDLVAIRNSVKGVRKSDGEQLSWNEHGIYRLENGRIKELWVMEVGLDLG